jgi:histidinol-phosphatase (PHP family)
LTGVELGPPHVYRREADKLLNAFSFDVVLISLHYLYGENIHLDGCFAGSDPQQVYADYFDELRRMVLAFPGHVVSHFDRILFRGTLRGAPLDLGRCERPIRLALESVATNALALELNTRLLDRDRRWRAAVGTMLGWYREAGGTRIVVNSDAHDSDQISQNFDLARDLLAEAVYPVLESDFLPVGAPS